MVTGVGCDRMSSFEVLCVCRVRERGGGSEGQSLRENKFDDFGVSVGCENKFSLNVLGI